jgi:hypothetical protein
MKSVVKPTHDLEHVRVVPVEGRQSLKRFISFPWRIYADDPLWVPPLLLDRMQQLSPRSPYFQHAQYRAWTAHRGEEIVGRISAQIDRLHLERHGDHTGFFGQIEGRNDPVVFRTLFEAVESWLLEKGMTRVLGPFNLSINQECGLLVEGFETPPAVMMGHAPPYYGERIEELGYTKAKDTLAYKLPSDFQMSAPMKAVVKRASERVRTRPWRKSAFSEELRILREIFDDAWSGNWGFVPFTEAEFARLGQEMKHLIPEDFVQIAELDGSPAAMIVLLPNINEAIKDLNGRLLPLGWLKLFWRLKVSFPRTGRVPLMGVRRRFHNSLLGAALALNLIDAVRSAGAKRGMKEAELSWILEDNAGMRNILESIGGVAYKRYRFYEKTLSQES